MEYVESRSYVRPKKNITLKIFLPLDDWQLMKIEP